MGTGQLSAWRFNVVRDRSVNAFSIGNGHVYVTEGAVSFSHSEAEIAAILAHEIGHQMAGHFCQPMQNPSKGSFGGFFDWLFSGNHDDIKEQPIGSSLTQVIDISKEKQADQYAVKLLKAAGYDPNAMLEVARRLPEQNGITHLRDYRRIHALENMLKGTAPSASQESPAFRQIQDKLRIE
jgi:predicted Zn-dependent protease